MKRMILVATLAVVALASDHSLAMANGGLGFGLGFGFSFSCKKLECPPPCPPLPPPCPMFCPPMCPPMFGCMPYSGSDAGFGGFPYGGGFGGFAPQVLSAQEIKPEFKPAVAAPMPSAPAEQLPGKAK